METLKTERKALPKHVEIKDLPDADRFDRLRSEKMHFMDTIKLIAYRAETAMAQIARNTLARDADARTLVRQLYQTEADLIPAQRNKTLTIRLHPLSAQCHDQVIRALCDELNATETFFPGTDLCLIYQIIDSF